MKVLIVCRKSGTNSPDTPVVSIEIQNQTEQELLAMTKRVEKTFVAKYPQYSHSVWTSHVLNVTHDTAYMGCAETLRVM